MIRKSKVSKAVNFILLSLCFVFSFQAGASESFCQGLFEGEHLPAGERSLKDGAHLRLPIVIRTHAGNRMVLANQDQLHKELQKYKVQLQIYQESKQAPFYLGGPTFKLQLSGKSKHLYRAIQYLQQTAKILEPEDFIEARSRLLDSSFASESVQNLKDFLLLESQVPKVLSILEKAKAGSFKIQIPVFRGDSVGDLLKSKKLDNSLQGSLVFLSSNSSLEVSAAPMDLYRFLNALEVQDMISLFEYSQAVESLVGQVVNSIRESEAN